MPAGLILGGAGCVFEDAERAMAMFEPDAIFVVNDMIAEWPGRADYMCSLHPEKLGAWLEARQANGYPMGGQVWAHKLLNAKKTRYPEVTHATEDWAGSSGLFAVKVALTEKFDKIVLAGVPIEPKAKHVVRKVDWMPAQAFRNGWKKRFELIKHTTRSMSGWTAELLGQPDSHWLNSR